MAHYAKDLSTRLVVDQRFPQGVRPYTVREYARIQGVPDTFTFVGSANDAYRMIGNGVSVPVGEWIGSEIVRYFQQNRVTNPPTTVGGTDLITPVRVLGGDESVHAKLCRPLKRA